LWGKNSIISLTKSIFSSSWIQVHCFYFCSCCLYIKKLFALLFFVVFFVFPSLTTKYHARDNRLISISIFMYLAFCFVFFVANLKNCRLQKWATVTDCWLLRLNFFFNGDIFRDHLENILKWFFLWYIINTLVQYKVTAVILFCKNADYYCNTIYMLWDSTFCVEIAKSSLFAIIKWITIQ
jgi:hypothetical protein